MVLLLAFLHIVVLYEFIQEVRAAHAARIISPIFLRGDRHRTANVPKANILDYKIIAHPPYFSLRQIFIFSALYSTISEDQKVVHLQIIGFLQPRNRKFIRKLGINVKQCKIDWFLYIILNLRITR